jgi:hypothetical protein
MHDDLERLIRLQRLDLAVELARRTVASLPDRLRTLDERLAASQSTLDAARDRLAASAARRRDAERDLAAVQGRLSKYRDQLMEVKTNREYQAMQKEIEVAQREVGDLEDRILECLLEADELSAAVKAAPGGGGGGPGGGGGGGGGGPPAGGPPPRPRGPKTRPRRLWPPSGRPSPPTAAGPKTRLASSQTNWPARPPSAPP